MTKPRRTMDDFPDLFERYLLPFFDEDGTLPPALLLKRDHSYRVAQEMRSLALSVGADDELMFAAEIAGLFHDIGRFEQYSRYSTFEDALSVDHASLGVRIAKSEDFFSSLQPESRTALLVAIALHNKIRIPPSLPKHHLPLCRMVRDADKIDILALMIEYYRQQTQELQEVITLGMPEGGEISDALCDDLLEGRIASFTKIRSVSDFKLLKIGWVYDLNYPHAFQLFKDRRYLQLLYESLPKTPKITRIYEGACEYLERRCGYY